MTSFGFESTTDDVLEGIDLSGKRVLVTGASAGLGVETTRALAAHGATVTMAVRDLDKGAAAMEQILATVPGAELDVRKLDLADLSSIRTFADGFLEDHEVLDVLIANAGIMACPHGTTVDGFELQFGTNHLGHFLLITRLMPALVAGGGARVVLLSSAGHRFSDVDLDDPGFEQHALRPLGVLRTGQDGQHPLRRRHRPALPRPGRAGLRRPPRRDPDRAGATPHRGVAGRPPRASRPPGVEIQWKSVPQGAATTVYAATSPDLDGQGGVYLEDCHIAEPTDDPAASAGVRAYALDPSTADALWDLSERLVG